MKRKEIERLLPEIFQRTSRAGNPLFAILEVMEAMHAPSEEAIERLDAVFNPYRAPDRFVASLARWVDLDRFFEKSFERGARSTSRVPITAGLGRLRELIAAAAYLSKWRGTAKGLLLFLETATGERGFEIEEQVTDKAGRVRPFHIRVRAPETTAPHRSLIEKIIESEKPAYVTYDIVFGQS